MDGRGRVYDNIFVERLWRSVKYEEAQARLGAFFRFYNEERLRETRGYMTPREVYFGTRAALAQASESDMDRVEIVDPGASGEDVFSDIS